MPSKKQEIDPAFSEDSNIFPIETSWILNFIPGAISGPVSRTLTAPLDRLRLEMQISTEKQNLHKSWKNLMADGGVWGLWKGNLVSVIKIAPEMALRFGFYESMKRLLYDKHDLSGRERLFAAAIAGAMTQCFSYPIEVLKVKLMIRKKGQYSGILNAVVKIYQKKGIKGFYRGFPASILGIVPYTGVDLTIYETLKNALDIEDHAANWKIMVCACTSIGVGQFSAYPFYLIKARQQAESQHHSLRIQKTGYQCELCKVFQQIIATDGVTGLYRGFFPTLSKVLPAGVINYIVYEYVKKHVNKHFNI